MALFTERTAIQQRMEEIREERRALISEQQTLMDRLRHLDSMDRDGVDLDGVLGSLTQAVLTVKEMVPYIPATALVQQVAQTVNQSGIQVFDSTEPERKEIAPAHVISHQQHLDNNKHNTQKRTATIKYSSKQMDAMVISLLKEKGVPVSLLELRRTLEAKIGKELNEGTFHNRMVSIMSRDKRLTKPTRGYYQYQM